MVCTVRMRVCSIECLYQPSVWLVHDFESCVLSPQQSTDVKFTFFPRQPIKYRDAVTFEINGLSRQTVDFTGQGTELKVHLCVCTIYVMYLQAACNSPLEKLFIAQFTTGHHKNIKQ